MNRVARSICLSAFLLVNACGDDGNVNMLPDAPLNDGAIDTPPPGPGMLKLTPTTSNFGSVVTNTTSTAMPITVTNIGEGPTGTITASISGAMGSNFHIDTNNCTTLAPAATCTINVEFSPSSAGNKSAALAVTASPGGSVQTTLDGIGILPGALTITPSVNAYGNITTGATSPVITYTVTNTGGVASGTLTTTAGGANPTEFTKTGDTCNATTLAPAATCTLMIQFAPTTSGPKSASFSVTGAPGGTVVAAVSGTALAPAQLFVNPPSQVFGSVVVGATSAIATFSVVNIGGVPTSVLSQTLQGTNVGDFTVVSTNCSGATLQPASSCTLTVRFQPSSTGAKTASVVVSAATGGSRTIDLSGTGIAPGQLTITPSNHGYGNAVVGTTSGAQVFVVENTGGVASGPLSTSLSGGDAAQFTISANACNGLALAPAATCNISVAFSPSSAGVKNASLLVAGTPGGTITASLSGNGIPSAAITITPTSRDFGSVGVGGVSPFLTFTVRNVGGTNAGVPAISLGGTSPGQFTQNSDCVSALAPLATCTVSVRFAPIALGNFTATVSATAAPGGVASATVFGQGVNGASLSVNPSNLQFADTLIGDVSGQLNFLVTNNGGTATGALTVGKSGPFPGDFNIVTTTCGTLAPGGTCLVTVSFQPTARGTRNASISVSGAPGGSVSVAVSGNARPRLEIIEVDFDVPVSPYDFGTVSIGGQEIVRVVVRNNTLADHTLTLTDDFGNPSQFYIWDISCSGKGKFVAHGVPTGFIFAEDICSIWVAFAPTSEGAKFGQTIFDIGPTPFDTATQQFEGNGANGLSIRPITQPPGFPAPTSDFGNVAVNATSPELVFEVRNADDGVTTGLLTTAALQVQRFQITDDGCNNVSLTPGATCFISVTFTPSQLGLDQTVLAVSATPGGPASLDIKGTGVDPSLLIFNPDPLQFGDVYAGLSKTLTVTVTNPAGAQTAGALNFDIVNDGCSFALGSGSGGGGGFCYSIVGGTCVAGSTILLAGQSCTVVVEFDSTGADFSAPCGGSGCGSFLFGLHEAELQFNAAPGTNGNHDVSMSANVKSVISMTPPTVNFGDVTIEVPTATFTVHNDSPAPTTMASPALSGATQGLQVLTSTCGGTLPANANCTIEVQWDVVSTYSLSATLFAFTTNGYGTDSSSIFGDRVLPFSCLQIKQNNPTAGTGVYQLDLDQGGPLTVIDADCDMVTDGGGYTSYQVFGGVGMSGVLDLNSCQELGMQLVIPRSRAHALSLIANYGDTVVPGVYGTEEGVNYGACPMSSSSSCANVQSDWTSLDGGDWFLNQFSTGEPNGDYVAGCFLGDIGSNSDGFLFNDITDGKGGCGYSFTDYVCSLNDKGGGGLN